MCFSHFFVFRAALSPVRCERLSSVKVKVPVLSVAVVINGIRGTQKVVPLSGIYESLTDQVDP